MEISKGRHSSYLWFIAVAPALGGFLFGYDAIVMSGTIPVVTGQFRFSPGQLGIFVSCMLWGCALGSALAGWLLDGLGRKYSLILSAAVMFASAVGSAFAAGPVMLIVMRFLGGVGSGLATVVSPLLIGELAPRDKRGRMVSLYHLFVCLGIVAAVFANWAIHSYSLYAAPRGGASRFWTWFALEQYWRAMFFAEAVPGSIFLFLSFLIPESPRWLMKVQKEEAARAVIFKISGEKRAEPILADIEGELHREGGSRLKDLFSSKWNGSLALGVAVCVLSEACGISAVLYYGPQLFAQAGFSLNRALGGFTLLALVNLAFNFVSVGLMDRAGRRKLLLIGSAGAMVSLGAIGLLFFLGQGGALLLIPFVTFMAFFAFSVGPVKFVLLSELFPTNLRGKAVSLATLCIWLTSAGVAYLFPVLREIVHTGTVFFLFALDLLALFILALVAVPETRGRAIEETSARTGRDSL